MKNNYIFQNKLVRKEALFYVFFKYLQQLSTYFCIKSIAISHIM